MTEKFPRRELMTENLLHMFVNIPNSASANVVESIPEQGRVLTLRPDVRTFVKVTPIVFNQ